MVEARVKPQVEAPMHAVGPWHSCTSKRHSRAHACKRQCEFESEASCQACRKLLRHHAVVPPICGKLVPNTRLCVCSQIYHAKWHQQLPQQAPPLLVGHGTRSTRVMIIARMSGQVLRKSCATMHFLGDSKTAFNRTQKTLARV